MIKNVAAIKLGGSVVTKKSSPFSCDVSNVSSLVEDIYEYTRLEGSDRLIIVHGGGSFSHRVASTYKESRRELLKTELGASLVSYAARDLNSRIMQIVLDHGLKAFSFLTSSMMYRNNHSLVFSAPELLTEAINAGWVPILFGDIVFDLSSETWEIVSSEDIISVLANSISFTRILVGTDKDGVLEDFKNPKTLVKTIDSKSIKKIKEFLKPSEHLDITGGMLAKVMNLYSEAEKHRIVSHIFNGRAHGLLLRSLMGDVSFGTTIRL